MHNCQSGHVIAGIAPGSIVEECGIEAGDMLMAIDGEKLIDRIDYEYYAARNRLTLTVRDGRSGEDIEVEIEKDDDENLGLLFQDVLMSRQRSCANACPFCFVDQMKDGLRETLYVKDDDWRMSFLMGNFITLTNVGERELDRIIARRISPLYISVQATEPALRRRLLENARAGELMNQLKRLAEAGLFFHGQFVLCPGLNDGPMLEQSLKDLWSLGDAALSVAVVPVGLTRYREELAEIQSYDRAGAVKVLETVDRWQKKAYGEKGRYFVSASDEFYILAGKEPPPASHYEGYPQIENGVGMLRKFEEEFDEALAGLSGEEGSSVPCSIATGISASAFINEKVARMQKRIPLACQVYTVDNNFFGNSVTVTGLLTGKDIADQLKGKELGERLYIPNTMLRAEDDLFLDGSSLEDIQSALGLPVIPVSVDGYALVNALAGNGVG